MVHPYKRSINKEERIRNQSKKDMQEEYQRTEGKKTFGTYRKPFHQWVKDYKEKMVAN